MNNTREEISECGVTLSIIFTIIPFDIRNWNYLCPVLLWDWKTEPMRRPAAYLIGEREFAGGMSFTQDWCLPRNHAQEAAMQQESELHLLNGSSPMFPSRTHPLLNSVSDIQW